MPPVVSAAVMVTTTDPARSLAVTAETGIRVPPAPQLTAYSVHVVYPLPFQKEMEPVPPTGEVTAGAADPIPASADTVSEYDERRTRYPAHLTPLTVGRMRAGSAPNVI